MTGFVARACDEMEERSIENVTEGMARVRDGDLEHRVAVNSGDELGRMADSFIRMTAGLKSTYAGLKREQDKLTTIILGAAEGVAVADHEGKVALVNPAMEKLVGKSADEIMAGGLEQLLDDPDTMARWLAGGSAGKIPTTEYNGHSFQVFAATVIGGRLRAGDDADDVRWCADDEARLLPLTPGLLDELSRMER